jgi:hypothetical protein
MKLWLDEGACDGFNVMPAYFPDEFELFVDQVIPLLQRRGLRRKEYEGTTLRHHLALPLAQQRAEGRQREVVSGKSGVMRSQRRPASRASVR